MANRHHFKVRVGDDDLSAEVVLSGNGVASVTIGDRTFDVRHTGDDDELVRETGASQQTLVALDGQSLPGSAAVRGVAHDLDVRTAQAAAAEAAMLAARGGAAGGTIEAPMPGRVVRVLVVEGDVVEAGAPVVIVEAMKMENELTAPTAGVVGSVTVSAGDTVDAGATLCVIETQDEASV